jgi:hypothetical protein
MSDNLEIWTGAAAMAAVCDAVKAAYERGLAEGLRRAEAVGGGGQGRGVAGGGNHG